MFTVTVTAMLRLFRPCELSLVDCYGGRSSRSSIYLHPWSPRTSVGLYDKLNISEYHNGWIGASGAALKLYYTFRGVCKYYIGPIGDLSLSTATAAG